MDAFLADAQLTEFSEPLKALGCVEVSDLDEITDDEYAEMGMSKVHVRRLRRKCQGAQTQGALGLGKEGEPVVVVEAVATAPPPAQVPVGLSRPASPPRSAGTSTAELLMLERMERQERAERAERAERHERQLAADRQAAQAALAQQTMLAQSQQNQSGGGNTVVTVNNVGASTKQRPRCFVCNGSGHISESRVPTESRLKPVAADSESLVAKAPKGYNYTVVTTKNPVKLQKEGRCYACNGAGDLAYGTVKCENCDGKGKSGAYIDIHDHQAACIASYCFALTVLIVAIVLWASSGSAWWFLILGCLCSEEMVECMTYSRFKQGNRGTLTCKRCNDTGVVMGSELA